MSRGTLSKSAPVGEIGAFIHSRITTGVLRMLNRSHHEAPLPLEEIGTEDRSPISLARLLIGRSNNAREAAVSWYLERRGIPFDRHAFTSFEGRGENFSVDIGSGDRVLVLIAHHDAVPGSPGANDNAVAVGILLSLIDRIEAVVPAGLRVRLLFTAAEELFYLGARAYVHDHAVEDVVAVLSLELCGIGDSIAVWDVGGDGPCIRRIRDALEGLGRQSDESYHVVGRIPVFGSDHRAFAAAGIPAYGISVVPGHEAPALRQLVLSPTRSALVHLIHRPPPFDTYHTSRDGLATLEPAAPTAVQAALEAIIRLS